MSMREIHMIMMRQRTGITHNKHRTRIMYTHKRIVCVTLDIECYDDLYLEDLDWKSLLDLEGDENVHVSIKEPAEVY